MNLLSVRARPLRWWVCGLLLLATMINYMDRLTLNIAAKTILADLGMTKDDYASAEAGFAVAFALGALVFGRLADRFGVYLIYPVVLVGWSLAGAMTGFATTFATLLACRVALGFMESGHWPCALITSQRVLPREERAAGNSILQSGAAIGAVVTPLVMMALSSEDVPGSWRRPFFVIGGVGLLWVVAWLWMLRPADLARPDEKIDGSPAAPELPRHVFVRRFAVLVVLVVGINMTWHFLRAWGPLYLQEVHDFADLDVQRFFAAYYLFTDLGALAAGFVALLLVRAGATVHVSRCRVFLGCALLTLLCAALPFVPTTVHVGGTTFPGWWLLTALFLLVGFGSLGVFPPYYSFTQDLTERNQGSLTGTLSSLCWLAMAAWQKGIGWTVTKAGYAPAFVVAGLAPLVAYVVLAVAWGEDEKG